MIDHCSKRRALLEVIHQKSEGTISNGTFYVLCEGIGLPVDDAKRLYEAWSTLVDYGFQVTDKHSVRDEDIFKGISYGIEEQSE